EGVEAWCQSSFISPVGCAAAGLVYRVSLAGWLVLDDVVGAKPVGRARWKFGNRPLGEQLRLLDVSFREPRLRRRDLGLGKVRISLPGEGRAQKVVCRRMGGVRRDRPL